MPDKNTVIAVYQSHDQAEQGVKEVQRAGFDMKKLSIIAKGYETEDRVVGYYNTGDRMKHWGKFGAFWGSIWGLLVGAAFLIIPGVGPVLIAGPLIAAVAGALEGAVVIGGLSVIGAALYSLGIPKDSIVEYESAIKTDKFLLAVHGSADEVAKAKDILTTTGPSEVKVHSSADVDATVRA